jgi:hypothetical protein
VYLATLPRLGGNVSQGQTLPWFRCNPFVPLEYGVQMAAPLEGCTKDKQDALVLYLVSDGITG